MYTSIALDQPSYISACFSQPRMTLNITSVMFNTFFGEASRDYMFLSLHPSLYRSDQCGLFNSLLDFMLRAI